jgi:hypothetical protein
MSSMRACKQKGQAHKDMFAQESHRPHQGYAIDYSSQFYRIGLLYHPSPCLTPYLLGFQARGVTCQRA